MDKVESKPLEPFFNNPVETSSGLTINDLNRYLPAIQTGDDIVMDKENMKEGLFLSQGIDGLKKIPSQSIDLIITHPPKDPWDDIDTRGSQMTLKEYYNWNQNWLSESHRILKMTGGIYLICDWKHSSMYHSLLSYHFLIQNRITWQNKNANQNVKIPTWKNQSGDIWFVTKSDDFLFNKYASSLKSDRQNLINNRETKAQTNLWIDIPVVSDKSSKIHNKLYKKILKASSFKLNWILDPFMRSGDVGVSAKKTGRRFIGFETNKDLLLLSMKRVDQAK